MGLATSIDSGRPRSGVEARRSTRIKCSVPLIVGAKNKMGQPFQERTSAVSLNLHGCRYQSRHDYAIGMGVTLRLTEPRSEGEPQVLQARVRSVCVPNSPSELYQVGVELESPANVWGISAPPQDWKQDLRGSDLPSPLPTGVTPVRQPVTVATTHTSAEQGTPTEFISAIQKAVRTAVAKQLDESLKDARCIFDDISRARLRQAEESFEQRIESIVSTAQAEIFGRLESRLAEYQGLWKEQQDEYGSRAEEIAQSLGKLGTDTRRELAEAKAFVEEAAIKFEPQITATLARASQEFEAEVALVSHHGMAKLTEDTQIVTREACSQLEVRAAESRSLIESTTNSVMDELRRQADAHVKKVSEASERISSSVAALDEESRIACEARVRMVQDDLARAVERSTEQFRSGLKALLSTLVGTAGAWDEPRESALNGPESSTPSSE